MTVSEKASNNVPVFKSRTYERSRGFLTSGKSVPTGEAVVSLIMLPTKSSMAPGLMKRKVLVSSVPNCVSCFSRFKSLSTRVTCISVRESAWKGEVEFRERTSVGSVELSWSSSRDMLSVLGETASENVSVMLPVFASRV